MVPVPTFELSVRPTQSSPNTSKASFNTRFEGDYSQLSRSAVIWRSRSSGDRAKSSDPELPANHSEEGATRPFSAEIGTCLEGKLLVSMAFTFLVPTLWTSFLLSKLLGHFSPGCVMGPGCGSSSNRLCSAMLTEASSSSETTQVPRAVSPLSRDRTNIRIKRVALVSGISQRDTCPGLTNICNF